MSTENKVTLLTLAEIDDILLSIREYLGVWTFRALLNVSARLMQSKKRFLNWNLTKEISMQYGLRPGLHRILSWVWITRSNKKDANAIFTC